MLETSSGLAVWDYSKLLIFQKKLFICIVYNMNWKSKGSKGIGILTFTHWQKMHIRMAKNLFLSVLHTQKAIFVTFLHTNLKKYKEQIKQKKSCKTSCKSIFLV